MDYSLSTEFIELDVTAGQAVKIEHGLGRPVRGWHVIWSVSLVQLWLANESDSTVNSLTLYPTTTGRVRLVLL